MFTAKLKFNNLAQSLSQQSTANYFSFAVTNQEKEFDAIKKILQAPEDDPVLLSYRNIFVNILTYCLGGNFSDEEKEKILMLVAVALNAKINYEEYTPEEFANILTRPLEEMDEFRLAFSIASGLGFKDARRYLESVIDYLEKQKNSFEQTNIISVYFLTLFLYLGWLNFGFLTTKERQLLLTNYFYKSVMLNIPVDKLLAKFLYNESYSINNYLLQCSVMATAIEQNQETYESVNGIVGKCSDEIEKILIFSNSTKDFSEIVTYVKSQYGNNVWLNKFLTVFTKIKNAALIDKYIFEEGTENGRYQRDLLGLIFCFYRKNYWYRILEYFKQKNNLVTISAFLFQLKINDVFDSEKTIQQYIDFNHFLQENQLYKDDIIIFNQSDNQFHWNEEILK